MIYFKKIDTMRAVAVLMVVISHWVPKTSQRIPLGEIGVDIFFVISGFLITRILLIEKEKAVAQNEDLSDVLKNFILRRALRIFPIYYLSLLFFWWLQDVEGYHIRENLVYYLTYTSNILFFMQNSWDSYLAPMWSLAVEEQFYLVWPLLMVLMPQKHTLKIILVSILIGMLFPYFFEKEMVKILTPSCMNALGGGALLAWLSVKRPELLQRYKTGFLGLTLTLCMLVFFAAAFKAFSFHHTLWRTVIALISVAWIMYCMGIYKPVKLIEVFMDFSPLIFIGQISYGIYLYHNLVSVVWRNFGVPHLSSVTTALGTVYANGVYLLIKFLLLLGFAWVSFKFIEQPFLTLKRHFVLNRKPSIV